MPGDREGKKTDQTTGTSSPAASQLLEVGKSIPVERAPQGVQPVQLDQTTPVQHQASTGPYVDRSHEPTWTVQRKPDTSHAHPADAVHAAAEHGIAGSSTPLPHLDPIQRAFGRHDVSGVKAHTDDAAREGATVMGAQAFASGDHVAFAGTPSLHTASHEAAHVVQQRGGVQLQGGVGEAGDAYERHADEVADAVVAGRSAEPILDAMAGGGSGGHAVQRNPARDDRAPPGAITQDHAARVAEQADSSGHEQPTAQRWALVATPHSVLLPSTEVGA
jgi:hypothetical protein